LGGGGEGGRRERVHEGKKKTHRNQASQKHLKRTVKKSFQRPKGPIKEKNFWGGNREEKREIKETVQKYQGNLRWERKNKFRYAEKRTKVYI